MRLKDEAEKRTNEMRVLSDLAGAYVSMNFLSRDYWRACPRRFASLFSENMLAPSISALTSARHAERNSSSCPSGIDFDSSSIVVPCSEAHSASANRV